MFPYSLWDTEQVLLTSASESNELMLKTGKTKNIITPTEQPRV